MHLQVTKAASFTGSALKTEVVISPREETNQYSGPHNNAISTNEPPYVYRDRRAFCFVVVVVFKE